MFSSSSRSIFCFLRVSRRRTTGRVGTRRPRACASTLTPIPAPASATAKAAREFFKCSSAARDWTPTVAVSPPPRRLPPPSPAVSRRSRPPQQQHKTLRLYSSRSSAALGSTSSRAWVSGPHGSSNGDNHPRRGARIACFPERFGVIRRSNSTHKAAETTAQEEGAEAREAPHDTSAPFPAVSRVDPKAGEQEAAIAQATEKGKWEHALELLKTIRDGGMIPSMAAHMDVISVCRRALQWDHASDTYRGMIEAHLPADLFQEVACDNYEDESNHPFARACGLVMEMGANGVVPNYATFRALLQFCKDEGNWEAAILLMEQSRRSKIKCNLFCFDLLIATVFEKGYSEVSTMLYELGVVEADPASLETADNGDGNWPLWPLEVNSKGNGLLELHDLPQSIALATVQVALLDAIRRPHRRAHWSGHKPLLIITGMGNNSKDNEAVIKPVVVEMLESMDLRPGFQQGNEGCIELKPANFEAFSRRMRSRGAAGTMTPA